MHAVARKVLLERYAKDLPVTNNAHGIVGDSVQAKWQADRDSYLTALFLYRQQFLPRLLGYPIAEKEIFTPVSGNGQLRETQQFYRLFFRLLDCHQDVGSVLLPIHGCLINSSAGDFHDME